MQTTHGTFINLHLNMYIILLYDMKYNLNEKTEGTDAIQYIVPTARYNY